MRSLLLLMLVSVVASTNAQNYTPLLDSYNEWQFSTCNPDCLTEIYFTDGDTLVDGQTYKILDGYHYISRGFLIREEVNEQKVYLNTILPSGNRQYLLYDFSLEVGDSIDMKNPITPFPEDAGYYQLDSIVPRPLVDGNDYDHYYLSPAASNTISTNNAVWIEGVGSLSIINAPGGEPDFNGVGQLSCMFKNGESFYSDLSVINNCEATFILGVEDVLALDKVQLVYKENYKEPYLVNSDKVRVINLYAINGVKQRSLINQGESKIALNFHGLAKGIYIVEVITQQLAKKTFKIII